MGTKLLINSSY